MSESLSIAVVGYGLVGKRHVDRIRRSPDLRLAAVVEPDERKRGAAAELNIPCFATIEEMFDKAAVDGVILATPTPLHVDQALECVAHGCPVLVEKPIAVTSQGALKLVQAAEAANVPLLVGHHRRHNAVVRAAKASIERGDIGELRAVQATSWFYKPDYYFHQAPWRTKKGAGPISVNLVHDVDLLRHFGGDVVRVQAQTIASTRGFENEELAAAMLTFASGAVATVSVSDTIAAPWSWEMTARENPAYPATNQSCYLIGGTSGALSIPDLRVWSHGAEPDWWSPINAKNLIVEAGDPLSIQVEHFAQVIRGIETPIVSGLEGSRSLQVVEAIQLAADSGKPINIRPLEDIGEPGSIDSMVALG